MADGMAGGSQRARFPAVRLDSEYAAARPHGGCILGDGLATGRPLRLESYPVCGAACPGSAQEAWRPGGKPEPYVMLDAITSHPGRGSVSLRRLPPSSDLDAAEPRAQRIDARSGLGHRFLVARIHLAHRRHFAGLPEASGAAGRHGARCCGIVRRSC